MQALSTQGYTRDQLNVVLFATRDWWEYQRRPHYTALSKYARVLAVELPTTPVSIIRNPDKVMRYARGQLGLRHVAPSLYVYAPLALMPYGLAYRHDWLSVINSWSFALDLQRILKRLDFQDWIQVFFLPHQEGIQNILAPTLRCFEIVDEYTTLSDPDTDPNDWHDRRVMALEPGILGQVDVVFVTSRALYEHKRIYNPHTYYVPNGADVDHFAKAQDNNGPLPPALVDLPSPCIGFIGHLTDFLEIDLLRYLARKRPDWSFVLIGENNTSAEFRTEVNFEEFLAMSNVQWLGRRNYEVLPDYTRGFDACIIPYQLRDRIRYSHPNKMYQYLASGKPVVSTDFPAVRELVDVIEVTTDYPEFLERLEKVLFHDTAIARARRIAVAQENSLDARAKQKLEILRRHLAERDKQ